MKLFEFIFVKGVRSVSRLFFLHVDVQLFYHHLLKRPSSKCCNPYDLLIPTNLCPLSNKLYWGLGLPCMGTTGTNRLAYKKSHSRLASHTRFILLLPSYILYSNFTFIYILILSLFRFFKNKHQTNQPTKYLGCP